MGWKAFKERFGITHIVTVDHQGNVINIGSPYVSNLLSISIETGYVSANSTFSRFGHESYPRLMSATREEILAAIEAQDTFTDHIPVYMYDGDLGEVVEKYCEETGWPNVTHDGYLMYNNEFSTDRSEVKCLALNDLVAYIKSLENKVEMLENDLQDTRKKIRRMQGVAEKLKQDEE